MGTVQSECVGARDCGGCLPAAVCVKVQPTTQQSTAGSETTPIELCYLRGVDGFLGAALRQTSGSRAEPVGLATPVLPADRDTSRSGSHCLRAQGRCLEWIAQGRVRTKGVTLYGRCAAGERARITTARSSRREDQ